MMATAELHDPANPTSSSRHPSQGGAHGGDGEGPSEIRLYEKWKKIYPLWVKGGFQSYRRVVLVVLLLVFYMSPWLTWNGEPAVWFNLPERKFVFLSATFWPQEFVFLSWLLIISAFSLFFVTVIAGRIWCGWACPQTVWTLCFVWIEKWVEGDRNQRMKLDRGPWNLHRITRKSIKYTLWLALAGSIAVTFVGYFVPIRVLIPRIIHLDLLPWEQFWLAFPTFISFMMSGVLREQVCFHMCPYARFQSVMFDRDTLIISYDEERGDPRGSRPRGSDAAERGQGSCINCQLCVSVCPTGIDIRDGLQYQCIGCAACIDVCNDVMEKMGDAPNLIRYSSENQDHHEGRALIRPRLIGYGAVLMAMIVAFTLALANRVPLGLDIIRDRNRLYRELWDGSVENVYTLKIMNREQADRSYRVSASGDLPVELKTKGGSSEVRVAAGALLSIPVRLVVSPDPGTEHNTAVEFSVETTDEPQYRVEQESRFIVPRSSGDGS